MTEAPAPSPAPLDLPRRPKFVDFKARAFTLEQLETLAGTPSIVRLDFQDCAVGDAEVEVISRHPTLQCLWLAGTQVTDAALPAIARLRALQWLSLDHTQVTGRGFEAFAGHTALRTLWLSDTPLADAAAPALAAIPGLSILAVRRTRLTHEGLMALARHPTLRVSVSDDAFDEQHLAFILAQRRHANGSVPGAEPGAEEAAAAARVLQDFFAGMTAWEEAVAAKKEAPVSEWEPAQCQDVFERCCTQKDRQYGRPNVLSFSRPPTYSHLRMLDAEWLGPRKVLFYAQKMVGAGGQYRFMVVQQKGAWRVDHKQALRDGWQRDYL